MAQSASRQQITIATVIARTAEHQHSAALGPASQELAKSTAGSGLHQLKAIDSLFVNQVLVQIAHRTGAVQSVWQASTVPCGR
jgi:restriction endonuclease Mrr